MNNEIELLNTHSAKRIRRIYLTDQILDMVAWFGLLGIIVMGAYWLVNL